MLADPKGLTPRALELMHKVADGSADSQEREEWAQSLATSPTLYPEFEAIKRVVQQVDALPLVEPPASMKAGILKELRQRRPATAVPLVSKTARSRWQRPALAWAAGIALIAGSAYLLERHPQSGATGVNPSDVAGTMGVTNFRSWRIVETREPAAAEMGLKLVLRQDGTLFAVEAQSNGTRIPGTAEFRWDTLALECVGVVPPGDNLEALNRSGTMRLNPAREGGLGLLQPVVVLRARAGFNKPQEVVLLAGGREYHRATISTK